MRLLKNAYEQNLAQCIAAAQRADFYSYSWSQILQVVGHWVYFTYWIRDQFWLLFNPIQPEVVPTNK